VCERTDEADGKRPHLFTAADGSPILAFVERVEKVEVA